MIFQLLQSYLSLYLFYNKVPSTLYFLNQSLLLLLSDFYGESENIDIAKGKYKFTTSIKEQWKQAQRKRLIEKKLKDNG